MKFITICGLCAVCAIVRSSVVSAQTIYQYKAEDATSVEFLGQKAYERNPVLAEISTLKEPLPEINFGEVQDSVKVYKYGNNLNAQEDVGGHTAAGTILR